MINLITLTDPRSAAALPEAGFDTRVILLCQEGFTSSLAADALVRLGIHRTTDVVGGFRAWREAGHPGEASVYLRIPIYAATTEEAAREEPRESITYYFARQAELARSGVGSAGSGPVERRRAQADRMARLSYDEILRTRVAFGSAAGLIDRLTRLRDELGVGGIVAELNPGGLIPAELERRSLHILTRQVMPALR